MCFRKRWRIFDFQFFTIIWIVLPPWRPWNVVGFEYRIISCTVFAAYIDLKMFIKDIRLKALSLQKAV